MASSATPLDQSALRDIVTRGLVDGRWISDGPGLPVHDPTTGGVIATVVSATEVHVADALDAAHRAERSWRQTPAAERSGIFSAVAVAMEATRSQLARIISSEVGKPLGESDAEVTVSASYFHWAAGQAHRATGHVLAAPSPTTTLITTVTPVGVVVAITPWNFPLAMVARKIAMPLALGCPVILKPSEQAPLSALFLAKLIQDAGLPDGVLNVLPVAPGVATAALLTDHRVRHVSFTGSAAAGWRIHRSLAGRAVGWSAELGGSAPALVLADADIDRAAALIAAAKFRNAGQTCVAPNRIIVAEPIYPRFVDSFSEAVESMVVGSWRRPESTMGPLKSRASLDVVRAHLEDARHHGAAVVGGEEVSPPGTATPHFMKPAVVLDWTPEMLLAQEETFGPVAPIRKARSVGEMVDLANDTHYGLAAYVFGTDLRSVTHIVAELDYGVVGVNQLANAFANAPIGGWKGSGAGVEGGLEGAAEYLRPKLVATDIGPRFSG